MIKKIKLNYDFSIFLNADYTQHEGSCIKHQVHELTDIVLVYPNLSDNLNPPDKFEILSGFAANEKINVTAIEIPFWSLTNFDNLKTEMEKIVTENLKDIKQNSQRTKTYTLARC